MFSCIILTPVVFAFLETGAAGSVCNFAFGATCWGFFFVVSVARAFALKFAFPFAVLIAFLHIETFTV